MPVSPARAAAFDILLRVEREAAYPPELLHSGAYTKLSPSDHRLATELVMGVLRWQSRLDAEIAAASSQPLARLDIEILIALRMAVYQFRWLTRVPARAALNESVELTKRAHKRSAAAFVNAVLRKLATGTAADFREDFSTADELAHAFAHSAWIVERWEREYSWGAARKICEHDQSVPETAIRLRVPETESRLREEGITLGRGKVLASARVVEAGDVTKTRAFVDGQIFIQDEGSQLVAALVGNGSQILDCCAAPGGKTLAIADRNPGAAILAVELHPHRARLLRRLLNPARSKIQVVSADACRLPTAALFDRILADVPCSGTGTLGRNPEIKWRLRAEDLAELQTRQVAILGSVLKQLATKGRLVYSTCSLEKEENEDVVERVMTENPSIRVCECRNELELLKASGELAWLEPGSLVRGPYLRTIPGIHPCDGFFAAILENRC